MNAREGTTIPPLADYCLFRQPQEGERPPAEAGAAMLALIQADLLPSFALVAYEPLERAGRDQPPPQQLALIADDAVLLAPRATPQGWQGFLIAEHEAAGQVRAFHWPGEPEPAAWLAVPAAAEAAAVWAAEAASLSIRPAPPEPEPPPAPPL